MGLEKLSWQADLDKAIENLRPNCPILLRSPLSFHRRFLHEINEAQESIEGRTMFFIPGKYTDPIAEKMATASARGTNVNLKLDLISRCLVSPEGKTDWIGRKALKPLRKLLSSEQVLEEEKYIARNRNLIALMQQGKSELTWVNESFIRSLFPFIGASHIKAFTVDGKIGWGLAGMGNLYDGGFESFDYMPETIDSVFIEALQGMVFGVNENKPKSDYKNQIKAGYNLLVDSGKRGQSIIYEWAMEMVENADSKVEFISQLLPDGQLLEIMEYQAAHGVEVHVFCSDKDDYMFKKFPFNLTVRGLRKKILRSEIILHEAPNFLHVHAKGLYSEGKRNQESLLTSHNLNSSGVKVGTEEDGLYTTDPQVGSQMKAFFECFPRAA